MSKLDKVWLRYSVLTAILGQVHLHTDDQLGRSLFREIQRPGLL